MLKGLVSLASYSVSSLDSLFEQWEEFGFFSYLVPFLLIFALVFGILIKIKLFKDNKAINALIALAVSLIAVQSGFVTEFFSEILPTMGIALGVILVLLILLGLFIDPEHNAINWILFGVGAIIFIVVLINTAGSFGWTAGDWLEDNWVSLIGVGIFIAFFIAVIASPRRNKTIPDLRSVLARDFLEPNK